jgi:Tfp pilus assembly protein PilX
MKRIKAVVKGRSNDEGFGLAVAVGFSLVAIMIGMTIVGRSLKDSGVSAAQKTTSRSLSAAEAGVTRYLSLINSDRYLAKYSHTAATGQPSWANSSAIPRGTCNTTTNNNTVAPTPDPLLTANQWTNLPATSARTGTGENGQFKLISYTALSGSGQLTVEGRIGQRLGVADSTDNKDVQTGNTRLQVIIPFTEATATSPTIPFPGLWINEPPSSNIQSEFNANVLLGCVDPLQNPPPPNPFPNATTFNRTSLAMPDNPMPPAYRYGVASSSPLAAPSPLPSNQYVSNSLTSWTSDDALPRSTDSYESQVNGTVTTKIYRYSVNDIDEALNINTVNTNAQAALPTAKSKGKPGTTTLPAASSNPVKIILYLNGDITKKGEITNTCRNVAGTTPAECELNNLQIYGYKANGFICLNGTDTLNAFIFAKTYLVGISGSSKGGFAGSIWAKSWDTPGAGCGSNTQNLVLTQLGDWNDVVPFVGSVAQPPQISQVNNWKIVQSSN